MRFCCTKRQIVESNIRENIGDDFLWNFSILFKIENSFHMNPCNSTTRLGHKSGYTYVYVMNPSEMSEKVSVVQFWAVEKEIITDIC